MTAVRTPLRPSRRSLLLSGAVLGSLGLAACDPDGEDHAEDPADLPPPSLVMEPLNGHSTMIPGEPVSSGLTPIAPAGDRPFSALLHTHVGYEDELHVVTPEHIGVGKVPIDPLSVSIAVDDSAARARVITSGLEDAGWRSTLLSSADLTTWEEVSLSEDVDLPVEIAGDGLVASRQDGSRIGLWALTDDGAVTVLTAIEVPEEQLWHVRGLARVEDTVVLLLATSDLRSDQIPEAYRTVLSTDGGITWSDPVPVVEDGTDDDVESLRRHGQQFVLLGGTRVQPEWSENTSYRRPTSWVSDDGKEFREVAVPLPKWGLDGWTWGTKGEVDAETEVDMEDLGLSAPVVLPDGGAMHLPIYFEDVLWVATRDVDGSWAVTERRPQLGEVIDEAVVMPDSVLVSYPDAVEGARLEFDTTWNTEGWERTRPFETSPGRRLVCDSGPCGTPLSLLVQRDTRELVRDKEDSSTEIVHHRGAWTFMIDDDEVVAVDGVPDEAWKREYLELRALGPGTVLLLGEERDEDGVPHQRAHVSVDGDWVDTSIDVENVIDVWDLTTIDEIHHLCVAARRRIGDEYLHLPVILTSSDGVEWTELGSADSWELPASGAEGGARVIHVEKVGETVMGAGSTLGEDGYYRAASFVLDDETWKTQPLEGAGIGSSIVTIDPVGDEFSVRVWTADLMEEGKIDESGTVTVDGAPTRDEWGRVIDLGDGLLVAPGAMLTNESGAAYGSCVWASRDGGASWGATTIPGSSGHSAAVHLLVDGEDLVAVTGPGGAVVAHRIVDPRAQLKST